ncbi:MAG TPA: GNAT family N-acetyltransferase [Polyangiaceae bacterium]|nr:GNAT family N-acetyltransferase [Polyangiaceae bacterium]
MSFEIREADWNDANHCRGLLDVLDSYAAAPIGGAVSLSADVRERLIPALRKQASALVLLALRAGQPVGAATCFYGFSTFYARPLLNVHDLAVRPEFQGRGIGRALLAAAEERARARGCCKLTLEVREDNHRARKLYFERGFRDFELAGKQYPTLFLSKPLA